MITSGKPLSAAIWLAVMLGATPPVPGQVTPIVPKPLAAPQSRPVGLTSTGDSAALITAVVRQSLDTLLKISGAKASPWLRLPPGPIWNDLDTLIRAEIRRGTLAGWCQMDGMPCPSRKHRQVALAWSRVLNPDSAVVFMWDGEVGPPRRHRPVPPPSDDWAFWRLAEAGIWPRPPVIIDGVLTLLTPTRVLMSHTKSGWRTWQISRTAYWDECDAPPCVPLSAGRSK